VGRGRFRGRAGHPDHRLVRDKEDTMKALFPTKRRRSRRRSSGLGAVDTIGVASLVVAGAALLAVVIGIRSFTAPSEVKS
jgi:hypothetical protein